jgi:hypothetical protein
MASGYIAPVATAAPMPPSTVAPGKVGSAATLPH